MKNTRIVVGDYGGPDTLQVVEEDCPEPKAGEVRVRVLAAGVSLPDVLAREGIHPETPRVPYTPGWDLVGLVDQVGKGVSEFALSQTVAAMPISGCYAQYVCLPQCKFIPVPAGLDAAEAVAVVLNYITAYQMLHRSAKIKAGQRVLIHGASGGVGTALLQLGRLAEVEMFGTCSAQAAQVVKELGAIPIDYTLQVVEEECPEPKPGEVRMKVLAVGVSLPNVLARRGVHPETPHVTYTPGWDLGSGRRRRVRFRAWPGGCGHADQQLLRTTCYAQYPVPASTSSCPGFSRMDPALSVPELQMGLHSADSGVQFCPFHGVLQFEGVRKAQRRTFCPGPFFSAMRR